MLRTVRIHQGVAEVRAGATLLYDSNPIAEEMETELKANAMRDALKHDLAKNNLKFDEMKNDKTNDMSIILIDHQDSFVHTLGNYLRQTGAHVTTLRSGPYALNTIEKLVKTNLKPDIVVLSPGPGSPNNFHLGDTIELLNKHQIPMFGVCLGLQGIIEFYGGTLGILGYPMHGKSSKISLTKEAFEGKSIFQHVPESFEVG